MLELTYVGHASWVVDDGDHRVICDPWLNPAGAFFSSWFPFPANDHLDLEPLKQVDMVYISHGHEDHFDPWFLKQLDLSIPILIPKYRTTDLRNHLAAMGFTEILECGDAETIPLGKMQLTLFINEDHGMYRDSALLVERDGVRVLNMNDCRLVEETTRTIGSRGVDALLKYFSGASAYPLAYDSYDDVQKKRRCREKRTRHLENLLIDGHATQAKTVIPCSGPAAFLDAELFHFNDFDESPDNPFPMMPVGVEHLRKHGQAAELVMPGDRWRVASAGMTLCERALQPEAVYDDLRGYLTQYAERKRPLIAANLAKLDPLRDPAPLLKKRVAELAGSNHLTRQIQLTVRFEFSGSLPSTHLLLLDPPKAPQLIPDDGRPFQYRFRMASKFAAEILGRERVDWEDLFLSMRSRAWRNPDRFPYFLYVLLKHMDAKSLAETESYFEEEEKQRAYFELKHGGQKLKIQRYCPHQGEDLSKVGLVRGDYLICPVHGWKFCLKTGTCKNVAGERIDIQHPESNQTLS